MPARSKAQFRYLEMLKHSPDKVKNGGSMSPPKVDEYLSENTGEKAYKNLPEKVGEPKKRFSKLIK